MSYTFNSNIKRPNKLRRKKDKSYHKDYAKFCLSILNNHSYRAYIHKCLVNWSFFKGGDGQWIHEEDIEAFFLDESGDIKNRIKWTKNVIKPMVQQYVGNAIRLAYDAKATCISDFVINKRESEVNSLTMLNKVIEKFPFFKDLIKEKAPVEDTEAETREMFYNTFVEDYEQDVNNLIEFISEEVNINELKVRITRNMALCGLGVYKGFEAGGNYLAESINPLFYFWDMSATKPDLTDAEYMGEWYFMDSSSIYERYQDLTSDQREIIENYGADKQNSIHKVINGIYSQQGGKIPVYEVYWKDVEKREYGWVKDDFGYPYYTMINHEDSPYKDKDLIKPQTEEHEKRMKGKKKHTIYVDVLRYCIMIPSEDVGAGDKDIILDYGILPYQEKNLYDPSNVKFPYKAYTWVYDRGEILTPLDDVIDPQRFLNRSLSVVESHMSNMRGTGTVISKSSVDDRDGEADIVRSINSSKPIFVDTDRVGSVQNAIGTYGTNIGGGTLQMFQAISVIQQSIQDVTGVNESMVGTGQSQDALVGVVQAQIQRGSLVQEPFYWAVTSILKQAYEHIATVGKSIYYDNPRKLAIMTGDIGMQNINLTKDHLLQDYRIFIKRAESAEAGVTAGNQLLFTLLQAGMIDQPIFANLFNRATPDLIANELRIQHRMKQQAQGMAQKAQMQGQEQGAANQAQLLSGLSEAQEAVKGEQIEDQERQHGMDLEKIALKESMKNPQQGQPMMPPGMGGGMPPM
tara:strand:+ start:9158 stop:11389 length:2232 start_codon:yes stop_codon:yes gene_type:complete